MFIVDQSDPEIFLRRATRALSLCVFRCQRGRFLFPERPREKSGHEKRRGEKDQRVGGDSIRQDVVPAITQGSEVAPGFENAAYFSCGGQGGVPLAA